MSLRLKPQGFCLVAEQCEGAVLSRCAAREVTVCDGGGASTSMFEICFVLLRTNGPGAEKKFMAVPAFESLRASQQQRWDCHRFPPSIPKCPEQVRAKPTASPQVRFPGAECLVRFVPSMHLESSFSQEIFAVQFALLKPYCCDGSFASVVSKIWQGVRTFKRVCTVKGSGVLIPEAFSSPSRY